MSSRIEEYCSYTFIQETISEIRVYDTRLDSRTKKKRVSLRGIGKFPIGKIAYRENSL